MQTPPVSPFDGEPRTRECRDTRGRKAYEITTRVLSPEHAQLADIITLLTVPLTWYVTWQACIAEAPPPNHYWGYVVWLLFPIFLVPVLRAFNRYVMQQEVSLEVTEETFAVSLGRGYVVFDRRFPHSFSVLPHDKAPDEQDELDAARQGKTGGSPRRYYTRAFIVTYDYFGQRQDIVSMMGQKEASALHARLVLCDKLMEAQRDEAGATPLSPSGEWSRQTGDLADVE